MPDFESHVDDIPVTVSFFYQPDEYATVGVAEYAEIEDVLINGKSTFNSLSKKCISRLEEEALATMHQDPDEDEPRGWNRRKINNMRGY